MKKLRTTSGKEKSIITCVVIGLITTILLSFILTIVLTSFVQKGQLAEDGNAGVFITRIIATLTGGLVGAGFSKKKFLPVIGTISLGYFVILISIGLLLLDGSLNNLWHGLLSTLIGGIIACLIKLKPQTTRKKRIRLAK